MGQTLPDAAAEQCRISWEVLNFGQLTFPSIIVTAQKNGLQVRLKK